MRSAFATAGADLDGRRIAATVSIGAATAFELPCDLDPLLARADAALYRAKQAGRNRLEADPESGVPVMAALTLVPTNRSDDAPALAAAARSKAAA